MSLSWNGKVLMFAHMHTHTHTCLTFKFHILFTDLFHTWRQNDDSDEERQRGKERGMEGWRETDQENSETLLLSPAFSLSAGSYLLWLCCSTETWADIKSKKVHRHTTTTQFHAHTHTVPLTHTKNIHLPSSATLRRHKLITLQIESSCADGDSYAPMRLLMHTCRSTSMKTHPKTWKYFADKDACCVLPKSPHSPLHTLNTGTRTSCHSGWRWKTLN